MGCFGKSGCPCCLTGAEIPFSGVKLKTPYENCNGSPGDPVYPQFGINPSETDCCFEGRFLLQCQPVSESCSLWAKRVVTNSFTVNYYQKENAFLTTEDPEPEGCCECTLVQSKSTSGTATARRFFGTKRTLNAIKITIGKTLIKCDGDEEPTCKYYIAATYEFIVEEGMSPQIDHSISNQSCTGVFRPGDCSISASWSTEFGEDTDTCPEDSIAYTELSTVEITRAKFYDELPTGEIEITADDDVPFSCCDGKVNCNISQIPCGLNVGGSNCFGNVPLYDEAEFGYLSVCFLEEGPLWLDEETGELKCFEVQVNGMYDQTAFVSNCFTRPTESGCYAPLPNCQGTTLGVDRFVRDAYDLTGFGNGLEGSSMCGALDVDNINPGNVAAANCDGDTQPPGLCTVPDCCVVYIENGFSIETNCQYLASPLLFAGVGGFCGRKITDYECDHIRTDYSAGAFCLSLPTVTLELV
jgi:hypothetical protein